MNKLGAADLRVGIYNKEKSELSYSRVEFVIERFKRGKNSVNYHSVSDELVSQQFQ